MEPETEREGKSMSKVRSRRVATVLLAPSAALAAWGAMRAAGVAFHVSTGSGRVGAGDVIVAAAVAALLAWVLVRWLERHVERPRLWWVRVGSACLAASIGGPSRLAGDVDSVALMGLHVVTAAVIVTGFAATVPLRRRSSRYPERAGDASAPVR
jgi:cytochrome c oxidase assembly factor CtaG